MKSIDEIYNSIVSSLEKAGKNSAYKADANEPDPRYKSYGVRAAGKKEVLQKHKPAIKQLSQSDQLTLARRLIVSEYGEQQSVGFFILEQNTDYFSPDNFRQIDELIRYVHGWSKIDSITGGFLRDIWFRYPDGLTPWVQKWNQDPDLWLRRASVVLFTRKVAKSGKYTDFALEMCSNLIFAPEDLVQKGVGWALKDLMQADKPRIINYVIELRKKGVPSTITLYAIRDLKGKERSRVLTTK